VEGTTPAEAPAPAADSAAITGGEYQTPARPLVVGEQPPQPSLHASTLGIHADKVGGGAICAGEPIRQYSHDGDIAPPIGVTTTFETTENGYVYSRWIAPPRSRCESVLAALEATPGLPTPHALLYASGLTACHAALTVLLPTTTRIAISGGYHGTHTVIDIIRELRDVEIIELPPLDTAAAVLQKDSGKLTSNLPLLVNYRHFLRDCL
jgi:cystathionine beta-lyase/cystathionine gamma-synthase